MPEKKDSDIKLKIISPTGREYQFGNPIIFHKPGQNKPYKNEKWGSHELLTKIFNDPKIKAISTDGTGLILAFPIESAEWIVAKTVDGGNNVSPKSKFKKD